jgi:hypothetical protein
MAMGGDRAMTSALNRTVPPQRLITAMNPMMCVLLRSPLHRALDNALLILHITGRKTGRRYDIPVGYLNVDGRVVVVTQHRWRRNVRGGADIDVTRGGHRQPMHAELDEEPATVAATLNAAIQQLGWPATQRQTGLKSDNDTRPSVGELQEAARRFSLATITLTAR